MLLYAVILQMAACFYVIGPMARHVHS